MDFIVPCMYDDALLFRQKNTADESEKGVSTVLPDTKNEVAVQILKKRDFNHELVSNGKISARGKAICVLKPVKSSLISM